MEEENNVTMGRTRYVREEEVFFALAYPVEKMNESMKSPQLGIRVAGWDDYKFVLSEEAYNALLDFITSNSNILYSRSV